MLFRAKKDVVGIDIGSSSVKLVQLHQFKGGYQLQTLGVAPLPSEAIVDNAIMDSGAVVGVIRNLLESLKVKPKMSRPRFPAIPSLSARFSCRS